MEIPDALLPAGIGFPSPAENGVKIMWRPNGSPHPEYPVINPPKKAGTAMPDRTEGSQVKFQINAHIQIPALFGTQVGIASGLNIPFEETGLTIGSLKISRNPPPGGRL